MDNSETRPDPDELLKLDGCTKLTKLSRRGIYRLIEQGLLPTYTPVGQRAIRIRRADLLALFEPDPHRRSPGDEADLRGA